MGRGGVCPPLGSAAGKAVHLLVTELTTKCPCFPNSVNQISEYSKEKECVLANMGYSVKGIRTID